MYKGFIAKLLPEKLVGERRRQDREGVRSSQSGSCAVPKGNSGI